MRQRGIRWVVACLLLAATGCGSDEPSECGDFICPLGLVCHPEADLGCAAEEAVAACVGLEQGASCSYPGVGQGSCDQQVCRPAGCGNGFVDAAEVCDDGNLVAGDGCSADCLSDETCGNGVVDVAVGETCDDGNDTSGDGCSSCSLE